MRGKDTSIGEQERGEKRPGRVERTKKEGAEECLRGEGVRRRKGEEIELNKER